MKKTFVEIYGLAVCFFSVACFVIVLGMAIWNAVGAAFPEFTVDSTRYEIHRSDETFSRHRAAPARLYGPEGLPGRGFPSNDLTGEDLTKARQASWERAVEGERRASVQGVVKKTIVLIISIIIYWIHWIIAKRARDNRAD